MNDQSKLRKQLADALDISEESVLQYACYGDHYSVITTNFQKFTKIYPAAEKISDNSEEAPETAINNTELGLRALPPDFPENLQDTWNNPRQAKVTELRKLAQLLGIDSVASKSKKAELTHAIVAYKLDYYA